MRNLQNNQNQPHQIFNENTHDLFFFSSFEFEYRYFFLNSGKDTKHLHITSDYAKTFKRLQYNKADKFLQYIIIDCDNNQYKKILKNKDNPQPNYIIENKTKQGGHLFFILDRPILKNQYFDYFADIFFQIHKTLTALYKGDKKNQSYIGKNYLNNYDFNHEIGRNALYSLNELKQIISKPEKHEQPKKQTQTFYKKDLSKIAIGERNDSLFNELRYYGYIIAKSKNLKELLHTQAENINNKFNEPLPKNEIKATANSIYKYIKKNKNKILSYKNKKKGKMNLSQELTTKEKQALSAERTSKIKEEKSKISIEIAIKQLKKEGKKVNPTNISKITKMSRTTILKYWKKEE